MADSTAPPAPAARESPFSLMDLALVVVLTAVGGGIVVSLLRLALQRNGSLLGNRPATALLWVALVLYLIFGAALLAVLARHRDPRQALQLIALPPAGVRVILVAIPIWILGFLAVSILTAIVFNGGRPVPANTRRVFGAQPTAFALLLAVLVTSVVAPVCEEVFFRGMLYQFLRARLGVVAAVVVSAALFAGGHGIPLLFPILFFMGCMLAIVFEASRSLYASIGFHAVNNAVAVILVYQQLTR